MDPLVDITESVPIAAAPEAVWGLVSDVRRHPEFAGPKSITKQIEFDEPVKPGARWIAHERFGPQKFDAPSEIVDVEPCRLLRWVSFPPFKETRRGEGGRVFWAYEITPNDGGCTLMHTMQVLPPERGATPLKIMYKVMNMPKRQRAGMRTSLTNIKAAAER